MRRLLATILLALALLPTNALAYDRNDWPYAWRDCPTLTNKGVTYVLVDDPDAGDFASVVAVSPKRKTVTLPFAVWDGGKRYEVRSVCEDTLSECPSLKDIYLLAELQECDDATLLFADERDVTIHVYTTEDYEWLTRDGDTANVVAEY